MSNNLFKGYRASDKQINFIFNFIEERSTDGLESGHTSTDKDGNKTFHDEKKSLTCERLIQELTYDTFHKGMQNASMAQASYLIDNLNNSHYAKVIEIFKQLNIIK